MREWATRAVIAALAVTLVFAVMSVFQRGHPSYMRFVGRVQAWRGDYYCSYCRYQLPSTISKNFCPNCGCKFEP